MVVVVVVWFVEAGSRRLCAVCIGQVGGARRARIRSLPLCLLSSRGFCRCQGISQGPMAGRRSF